MVSSVVVLYKIESDTALSSASVQNGRLCLGETLCLAAVKRVNLEYEQRVDAQATCWPGYPIPYPFNLFRLLRILKNCYETCENHYGERKTSLHIR
jgi:hypothetical protein